MKACRKTKEEIYGCSERGHEVMREEDAEKRMQSVGLVFLCVCVGDSEYVLHQPSLTV